MITPKNWVALSMCSQLLQTQFRSCRINYIKCYEGINEYAPTPTMTSFLSFLPKDQKKKQWFGAEREAVKVMSTSVTIEMWTLHYQTNSLLLRQNENSANKKFGKIGRGLRFA